MNKHFERESSEAYSRLFIIAWLWIVIFGLLMSFTAFVAHAEPISDDVAVHCILGEVRGELAEYGMDSFIALAESLRNRGTTQGVYGCKASLFKEYDYLHNNGYFSKALLAWNKSKETNLVKGAQYWGSTIYDIVWILKMERAGYVKTYTIGNTAYYRK